MSWVVCVSATSTDGALAASCSLRSVLGATSTDADTVAYHQALLVRASRWAESYIGRPLLSQVYSEKVAGYGAPSLLLAHRPIRAVLRMFGTTATCDATQITSTEIWIDDAEVGTLTRPEGFAWTALAANEMAVGVAPGTETKPWLVEYQAGYIGIDGMESTDGGTTSTERTLPEDIEQAVLMKAAELAVRGGSVGVSSKKVGDLSITYDSQIASMTGANVRSEAEELLRPYRSIV